MSLLSRVKRSLEKNDERECEEEEIEETVVKSFKFNGLKWVIADFMDEIKNGDLLKIPVECMLTHFFLRNNENGNYILFDGESKYEIYEMDWLGDNYAENGEYVEPEYREISGGMDAVKFAEYLRDKIVDNYDIYIVERKTFDSV